MPCAQWLTMGGKAYSHWRCIIGSATLGGIPKKLNPSTILLLGRFQPRFQDEIDSSWFQEIPTDAQHVFAALFRTGCDWSYATSPETREISPAGSFLHPCTFWTLPHAIALVQFCSVHLGFQQFKWCRLSCFWQSSNLLEDVLLCYERCTEMAWIICRIDIDIRRFSFKIWPPKKINVMSFFMAKIYNGFAVPQFWETSHDNTLDLSFDVSEAEPSGASWKVGRAATPRDGRTRGVGTNFCTSLHQQIFFSRVIWRCNSSPRLEGAAESPGANWDRVAGRCQIGVWPGLSVCSALENP